MGSDLFFQRPVEARLIFEFGIVFEIDGGVEFGSMFDSDELTSRSVSDSVAALRLRYNPRVSFGL